MRLGASLDLLAAHGPLEHLADRPRACEELLHLAPVAVGEPVLLHRRGAVRHPPAQVRALLEGSHRLPERRLDLVLLAVHQRARGVAVAEMATVAKVRAHLLDLLERAG